jgi:hypothetical protein
VALVPEKNPDDDTLESPDSHIVNLNFLVAMNRSRSLNSRDINLLGVLTSQQVFMSTNCIMNTLGSFPSPAVNTLRNCLLIQI